MYYKIEDKKSKIYQDLLKLRNEELEIEKQNIKSIEEKAGLKWKKYLGRTGQQNFRRVTQYQGFEFINQNELDLKIWKEDNNYPGIFVPNRRTKAGREMQEFLCNGLKGSMYSIVFEILKIDDPRSFTFPYVEICDDIIIIFLGDKQEPTDKEIIEITKKEFECLQKAN